MYKPRSNPFSAAYTQASCTRFTPTNVTPMVDVMLGLPGAVDGLLHMGRRLDEPPTDRCPVSPSMHYAEEQLKIRDRSGTVSRLIANPVQAQFERMRGKQNIVVKARQMGITTWIAGRFF